MSICGSTTQSASEFPVTQGITIQNFHLERYIVGYTVGNLVLRRRISGAVKRDFRRISDDIHPQMKILNMVIPNLMHY